MTDQGLVSRARSGDTSAFGQLVELHRERAYAVALGLVGTHEEALDLSQEAFSRAFRARRRLDPERPFFAWLYQILRRLCFNHIRDEGRRRRLREDASSWLVAEADTRTRSTDPAEAAELSELQRLMMRSIEELPDREREVLVLREFEGLKYQEIADLVGVPVGTVMSRLFAARRRVAESMEEAR